MKKKILASILCMSVILTTGCSSAAPGAVLKGDEIYYIDEDGNEIFVMDTDDLGEPYVTLEKDGEIYYIDEEEDEEVYIGDIEDFLKKEEGGNGTGAVKATDVPETTTTEDIVTTAVTAATEATTTTQPPVTTDEREQTTQLIEFETEAYEPEVNDVGAIHVLMYYDLEREDPDLVELFKSRYGGSLNVEICASGESYFENLGALVASGLSPDIVRYEWMSFPYGVSRNMYTPLDDYIDLDSELWSDMKGVAEQFVYNGKHYYVPYRITSNYALNYNRAVLEKHGLADPVDLYKKGKWTWSAFEELVAEWCSIDENHIGYTGVNALPFVSTTGKKVIDVNNNKITNNLYDSDILRTMNFLEMLSRNGYMGEGFVSPNEAFIDGNLLFLGMEPTWTYDAACESLYKNEIEYDMAFVPFPRDDSSDKYYIAYDSFGYMVPKGAENIEGAVSWINLCREEEINPMNVALRKAEATDTSTKYYPKCPECKLNCEESGYGDLPYCYECNSPRKVKFFAYYTEEQYDLLMEITDVSSEKFSFVFDNYKGFDSDLINIFEGMGESSVFDGPIFYGISYEALCDENYDTVEAILDEYREKMIQE